MIESEQKYTMSIILKNISIFKFRFFILYFCVFLSLSSNLLHSGPKDKKRRRVSEKNGGTVITSAGGIGSPAKYKDISHENEERRV